MRDAVGVDRINMQSISLTLGKLPFDQVSPLQAKNIILQNLAFFFNLGISVNTPYLLFLLNHFQLILCSTF